MRRLALAAALLVSLPLCAQDKVPAKKKKAAAAPKAAHQQASKEQIRKFNEMQKKQQK
ncbi:MAG TPA: hypothetical protein VGO02_10130 [Burkholderiales bacterium]|nr:hypothetical protein [Burkholderiales bacterium]